MSHCPYCGNEVKEDEHYCINCGEKLPENTEERTNQKTKWVFHWFLPLIVLFITCIVVGGFYIFLYQQTANAKDKFHEGKTYILNEHYDEAENAFQAAIKYDHNFPQAITSSEFIHVIKQVEENNDKINQLEDDKKFKKALTTIENSENMLNIYNGEIIKKYVSHLQEKRNAIQFKQLKKKITDDTPISELKILLWEAEDIQTEESQKLTKNIRKQIIDYTFSSASNELNDKQFADALIIVKDGLKYAPHSDKLKSLKTTIDKAKTTFETKQKERIEQAVNLAIQEQENNETDAIKLKKANVKNNKKGNIIVEGEVESTATIPVSSILVAYTLTLKDGSEIASNKVYVYPDTLYPDEVGKFDFTHFDISQKAKDVKVKVTKIRWFTN